ncbi:MAG TPA: GntR family transcriptional regulator [Anaerolineales bacterium]|nr:GntR family transcriptional regulator [Anaerolineales bacterium]
MNIRIDKTSRVPIYDQIKEQIKGLIHARLLRTGDQLPTIRELSVELAVNFNTVALSYRDLANEGIIITERGRGTFVAGTPGEEEMQRLRQAKLQALVETLLQEAERLGYTRDEVGRAFVEQIRTRGSKPAPASNA